jgi:Universal stress protein UspA and related nucleotide-binding proteins
MEDKLVTLAILTYSKAQILKNVLENEGIEAYIHNVNQIQPVVSSGVRVRIKESDLPHALKIIESSAWLSEDVVGEKEREETDKERKSNIILVPIDFSDYSLKASELGFKLAKTYHSEVVLLHAYYTPIYASSLPYGDVFNYQIADDESVKTILQKVNSDINKLSEDIRGKIESGDFPNVKYNCVLREGIPEEEILRYSKEYEPVMIVMGTRGKNQKDIDLIGSVTAEVIDRSRVPVLTIPENTPIHNLESIKRFAFLTTFDQRDLITFDIFLNALRPLHSQIFLINLTNSKDSWNEVKLAGIKEYFQKQYPALQNIQYDVVMDDDLLDNLDKYIKSNHIDLITLPSYKRNIFSRLFNPGIAKKMVFHSDTPLLIMK